MLWQFAMTHAGHGLTACQHAKVAAIQTCLLATHSGLDVMWCCGVRSRQTVMSAVHVHTLDKPQWH